jgi:hypothetical protein
MRFVLSYITFFCVFSSYSQNKRIEITFESNFSTNDSIPFWMFQNKNGISQGSAFSLLSFGFEGYTNSPENKVQIEYGFNTVGTMGFENIIFFEELYFNLKYRKWNLDFGSKNDDILFNGLSHSNGNFVKSTNSRNMPGINLSLDYIPFLFWKDWFSWKFNYGEYIMLDERYVKYTQVHNKSLWLKFKLNRDSDFRFAVEDWLQWGGDHPSYGRVYDFEEYLRAVWLMSGGDNNSEGDQINRAGNHIGNYQFIYENRYNKGSLTFYYSHPFEDGSGMAMRNFPDGILGIYLKNDGRNIFEKFLIEWVYSKDTTNSGAHDVSQGQDKYFENYYYKSGWFYFGQSIGTPLIQPIFDENGIVISPQLNFSRFSGIHFGVSGSVMDKFSYKSYFTYVNYDPWYGQHYSRNVNQFSGYGEVDFAPWVDWSGELVIGGAFDAGNRYSKNLGAFIRLSYQTKF